MRIPTLDDRTFDDLVREGLRAIGSGDGEWTDRNPSDPGITLLEVLAYATEALMYRVNQVTGADLEAFARLLAPDGDPGASPDPRDRLVAAVRTARERRRLVSCADYEATASAVDPHRIGRAHCVANRDLTATTAAGRQVDSPGHVTVLLVPRTPAEDLSALCVQVRDALAPHALLTTRLHVGQVEPVEVAVRARLGLRHGAAVKATLAEAAAALSRFLDPSAGGPDGTGWPLGRAVHVSEIYRVLDGVPGVDFVSRVPDPRHGRPQDELLVGAASSLVRDPATGELVAVRIEPHQVAAASSAGHLLEAVRAGARDEDEPEVVE